MRGPENLLSKAKQLSRRKERAQALEVLDSAVDGYPDDIRVLRDRAHLLAKLKRFHDAIDDITEVVRLSPGEPDDYFSRARWALLVGDNEAAIDDLTAVIAIESASDQEYYTEAAYFFRAEAYLCARNYDRALRDCGHIRDEIVIPLKTRYRSKADIEQEALQGLGRRAED